MPKRNKGIEDDPNKILIIWSSPNKIVIDKDQIDQLGAMRRSSDQTQKSSDLMPIHFQCSTSFHFYLIPKTKQRNWRRSKQKQKSFGYHWIKLWRSAGWVPIRDQVIKLQVKWIIEMNNWIEWQWIGVDWAGKCHVDPGVGIVAAQIAT